MTVFTYQWEIYRKCKCFTTIRTTYILKGYCILSTHNRKNNNILRSVCRYSRLSHNICINERLHKYMAHRCLGGDGIFFFFDCTLFCTSPLTRPEIIRLYYRLVNNNRSHWRNSACFKWHYWYNPWIEEKRGALTDW